MRASYFGQLSLWILLLWAGYFCMDAQLEPRGSPVVALSVAAFLPPAIGQSALLFSTLKTITLICALFWGCNLLLPYCVLGTTFGLFSVLSMAIATQVYTRHTVHALTVILCIYGAWYLFRSDERKNAPRIFLIGRAAPYPAWVYWLSLFYLTTTYTFSGITKLYESGLAWPSGTSLQLWCWRFAEPTNLLRNLCIQHPTLGQFGQHVVLFAEATAIFAFFVPFTRRLYGVVFIAFHIAIELLFGFEFYAAIFIDLLFLVVYPAFTVKERSRPGMRR